MNRYCIISLLLLFVFLLIGCRDEQFANGTAEGGNTELPDGRIAFALYTSSTGFQRPVTRTGTADEDNARGDMWVFVFDASTTDTLFLEAVKVSDHEPTATTGQSRRTGSLQACTHKVTLLVLDNAPAKIHNGTTEVNITDAASWGLTTTTKLVDARKLLNTVLLESPQSTVPYTPALPMPMSAELNREKLDASVNLGIEAAPLPLLRVVAKVSVKKDFVSTGTAVAPDFTLKGATVYNTPKNASLFPVHKTNTSNLTDYIAADPDPIVGIAPAVNGSTMMNPIYLYPSAEANVAHQPFVLIQARYANDTEDTYYKLAIAPPTKPRGRVERNADYRLLIKECTGRGYNTAADAIAASPSNLIYTVQVTDLSSHDIIDNGQYYIGLSNSEYHFYAYNSFVNLPVATLNTGNNPGTIPFAGSVTITSSDPTNLVVQTPTIVHPATNENIRVGVTKEFVSGVLTVCLGNLTKEIKVVRKSNSFIEVKDELIINNNYASPNYKIASVVNPKPWIKLSTTSAVTLANGQDMVTSNAGGVYIAYNANMAKPDLENFVYISRSTNEGRIKAHFLLSPLVFLNTDAPPVIDRYGRKMGGSTGPYNFNFSNPSSYDYKVALFPETGNPTMAPPVVSATGINTVKNLEYSPLQESELRNLPRIFVAKVNVGNYWYETDYYVQQRWELAINILTVGSNGIDYHQNKTGQDKYGIKLGSASGTASNTYNAGLGPLLWAQTSGDGTGKNKSPIEIPIQLYHLSNNNEQNARDENYDSTKSIYVLKALEDYNIDILVCFVHGNGWNTNGIHGPTQAQAQEIIDKWLLKSKYRGMIYTCDGKDMNIGWSLAIFGEAHNTTGTSGPFKRLPTNDKYYNHPVYRSIMSGSYSKYEGYPTASDPVLYGSNLPATGGMLSNGNLRNSMLPDGLRDPSIIFGGTVGYGVMSKTASDNAGFIPLLYKDISGKDYVSLAVHSDKRIVFQGELQYYDAITNPPFLNSDGSLAYKSQGPYPKLMMNMWEWFINNVALGKRY